MPLMEKVFDRGKNRISLFFKQSPDVFFRRSPDFPLPGIGRSAVKPFLDHLYLKTEYCMRLKQLCNCKF